MMTESNRQLFTKAKAALRHGERGLARKLAYKIVENNPEEIEGWLLLGGLSNPKSSLAYIEKAYLFDPDNPSVIKALEWAKKRLGLQALDINLDNTKELNSFGQPEIFEISKPIATTTHRPVWVWTFVILLAMTLVFLFLDLIPMDFVQAVEKNAPFTQGDFPKPSLTPTVTNTPTPTPTPTSTPTPTPTNTPTPTLTTTPIPIDTQAPGLDYQPVTVDVDSDERWIDIDLSDQRLYAYVGEEIIRSFMVSTGTWQYPTPVGQFAVWIKLRYTNMSGPGYFLPDVPYTMYFYKDYGIHGTYWHNNFGTPMSHGCVNMITEEAGWLFDWSHIGILVNVHE